MRAEYIERRDYIIKSTMGFDIITWMGPSIFFAKILRIASNFLQFKALAQEKAVAFIPEWLLAHIWRRLCALVLCSKYGSDPRSDESVEEFMKEHAGEH